MTFGEAVKKAMEQGGSIIHWRNEHAWEIYDNGAGHHIKGNDDISGSDWAVIAAPKPAPEPELMTGYAAIAKAAREGGEVYGVPDGFFRVAFDANGNIINESEEYSTSACAKAYTVRPLPEPYPLSFAEAWEALGRGESVIMQDFVCEESGTNEVAVVIEPYLKCKAANSGAYVSINRMHDSKFSIVKNERKD